ncbi:MAG: hypothetical protein R3E39_28570 [Anaerolineae bacterium]
MPYTVEWYIEYELVFARYLGAMTPDELHECLLKMKAFMDSSPRSIIHAISDVGDVVEAVSLKESLPILRAVGRHPRAGWSVSIRERSLLVKMGSALGASLFNLRYRSFGTLDEAITLLKEMDESLNWDNVKPSVTAHITGTSNVA